jgi:hypothetical protein
VYISYAISVALSHAAVAQSATVLDISYAKFSLAVSSLPVPDSADELSPSEPEEPAPPAPLDYFCEAEPAGLSIILFRSDVLSLEPFMSKSLISFYISLYISSLLSIHITSLVRYHQMS